MTSSWTKRVALPISSYENDYLYVGDYITSENGRFVLTYHGSGELILYDLTTAGALWGSNTANTSTGHVVMQGDGNLVIYTPWGTPIWSSGTVGHPGAFLQMQNDGNLVIYHPDGWPLWSSGTACC